MSVEIQFLSSSSFLSFFQKFHTVFKRSVDRNPVHSIMNQQFLSSMFFMEI